jgi:four helix bundle protein
MQDYRKLTVWGHAHAVVLHVYRVTGSWPARRDAGLGAQLRRASASVPANIVEGCSRASRSEFARFLDIAYASAAEVEYHLLLARDLGLCSERDYDDLSNKIDHVQRMLRGLQYRVKEEGARSTARTASRVTRDE